MEKKNNHKNDDNELVTKGYLRVTLKETLEEAFSSFAHKYIVPIYDKFAQMDNKFVQTDKNFASMDREMKIFRSEVKSEFADVKVDIADIKKDVKDVKRSVEKHDKRITAVEDWIRIRP